MITSLLHKSSSPLDSGIGILAGRVLILHLVLGFACWSSPGDETVVLWLVILVGSTCICLSVFDPFKDEASGDCRVSAGFCA